MVLCSFKAIGVVGLVIGIFGLYLHNYMLFCTHSWNGGLSWGRNGDGDETLKRIVFVADPQIEGDVRELREGFYGLLNNIFNDFYYRHIHSNIEAYLKPEFIVLLGDIFSSQHMDLNEYEKRCKRYDFIFGRNHPHSYKFYSLWGNHDIGYGSEAAHQRTWLFETRFGKQNAIHSIDDAHDLVIQDSIPLDGAASEVLHKNAWDQLHLLQKRSKEPNSKKLIFATHIPLYKPHGSCHDSPNIQYLPETSLVYTQTMLTRRTSDFIIKEAKPHVIFSGHDHHGCKYVHKPNTTEYTVRSMLGDYGGYTAVYDIIKTKYGQYQYKFYYCPFFPTSFIMAYFVTVAIWMVWILFVLLVKCISYNYAKNSRNETHKESFEGLKRSKVE